MNTKSLSGTNIVVKSLNKGLRIARREGPAGMAQRIARMAYSKSGAHSLREPLLPTDIVDSTRLNLPDPLKPRDRSEKLTVGWVAVPPTLGSGGHTTMFRMVRALEERGHRCVVYLYDRFGGDIAEHAATIRIGWPDVEAEVRDASCGITGLDACVATSWESAHVLASRGVSPMRRLYFVQDFEPYFYPRGTEYFLAMDSYRFGFRPIALGNMVAGCLLRELNVQADVTPFGCDTSVYHLDGKAGDKRDGVVFYARSGNPRRGYWLGRMALEKFHSRHPNVPIYVYGDQARGLPFPAQVFPRLTPAELNELYNRSLAGLALSFTNISLVAEELLSAGAIPIVNDSSDARADLVNPHVAWATPSPDGIADALSSVVSSTDIETRALAASASVRDGWTRSQRDVVRIIEEEAYGEH